VNFDETAKKDRLEEIKRKKLEQMELRRKEGS
jgi:hypothetical protein